MWSRKQRIDSWDGRAAAHQIEPRQAAGELPALLRKKIIIRRILSEPSQMIVQTRRYNGFA
jgi:hypothetical protein